MAHQHIRIVQHHFAASLQGALLDSFAEEWRGKHLNIILDVRAFQHTAPAELFLRGGAIHERIQGIYLPIQLHFYNVSELKGRDFFSSLKSLSLDEPARTIIDMLSWRQPERDEVFYLLSLKAPQADDLMFFASRVTYKKQSDRTVPVTLERDWCPPPPMPGRLVPQPRTLHRRFGGDPITFHLDGQPHHRRLFIGGIDIQPDQRPRVDVVFNVGEEPSKWIKDTEVDPPDRWENKGEGSDGMSVDDLREEAGWVIEHLRRNQRVLVHCVAGMNRSSTICCGTLILLERLTAEQALERVREHHPWARPDSRHWLKLRWLAKTDSQQLPNRE